MSYKQYTGSVKARGGKGKEAPQCEANLDHVIPADLDPDALIDRFKEKYGAEVTANYVFAHWKVEVQKAGQNSIKAAIAKGTEPNLDSAASAMIAIAEGDMLPQYRSGKPKVPPLTSADVRKHAETTGIKGGKLDAFIQNLLDSGKIKS